MSQHEIRWDRLNDYVDGVLGPAGSGEVERHLERCAECRREVEALRSLGDAAGSLPRGIAPPRDLWEEIRARIDAPAEQAPARVIEVDFRSPARQGWRRWGALAAAAVVLVVLSSSATALLMRGGGGAAVATLPAETAGGPRATTALAAFRPSELEYRSTVEALEAELAERRGRLAPETVAVIEENLLIIDQAIAEARAALEADPGNPDLPLHLSGVYHKKVELLQSAISLPQS